MDTQPKKPLYVLIALILMAGLGFSLIFFNASRDVRSRATNSGPTLTLNPGSKSLAVGNTFAIGLTINTNSDTVSAVELHLSYDPTAIQILNFTPGTPLPIVLVPETHANGAIAVTLGVQPTAPFKGGGIIGTWVVKILSAKQSSVSFTSATEVAAIGKSTNALAFKTGSTITGIGVSETPTPTPSPTSTPSPTPTPIPTSTPTPTSTPEPTSTPTPTPTPNPTTTHTPSINPTPYPTSTKTTFGSLSSDAPHSDLEGPNQTPNDYTSFPDNAPETQVPKLTIFDQIFASIIRFFQGLFKR